MSYHGRLNVVTCDARMAAFDVGRARRLLEKNDVSVDSSFLDEMQRTAEEAIGAGRADAMIAIPKERCWFSGNHVSEETLVPLARMIAGQLAGYFVGKDGSLYGGFVIEGGKLAKREIVVSLVDASAPAAARSSR